MRPSTGVGMNGLLLVAIILCASAATCDPLKWTHQAKCRNHKGLPVDWWFIIKDYGSTMEYIYYDSIMAARHEQQGKVPVPYPLDSQDRLDDPKTSPLLRTIYMRGPKDEERPGVTDSRDDTTLFIAINDQPPPTSKSGAAKDVFGNAVGTEAAHTKLFLATQVDPVVDSKKKKDKKDPPIHRNYTFAIQHTLPQFPNLPVHKDEVAQRYELPEDPADLFSPNARRPQSPAQHFFCTSFEEEMQLDDDGMIAYSQDRLKELLEVRQSPLISILWMMRSIHAAVIGTNYLPWRSKFAVYHRLLDIRSRWSRRPIPTSSTDTADDSDAEPVNYPRMRQTSGTSDEAPVPPTHLFPLWASRRRFRFEYDGKGRIVQTKSSTVKELGSLRSSESHHFNDCWRWDPEEPMAIRACLGSLILRTTDHQYGMPVHLVYKNGLALIDMYDDLIGPMAVNPELKVQKRGAKDPPTFFHSVALIVQSWIDFSTLGTNSREMLVGKGGQTAGLKDRVNLWVSNSMGIRLPYYNRKKKKYGYKFLPSNGHDHSKWAVAINRVPNDLMPLLFCLCDLNRTRKHTQLKNSLAGRGGACWCTTGPLAVIAMSFYPVVQDTTAFSGIPPERLRAGGLYNGYKDPRLGRIDNVAKDGFSFRLEYEPRDHGNKPIVACYRSPLFLPSPSQDRCLPRTPSSYHKPPAAFKRPEGATSLDMSVDKISPFVTKAKKMLNFSQVLLDDSP